MANLIDYSVGTLGEVKYSRLTEAQFQAIYGTGWVLYDGRTISGSRLGTLLSISTLEDHRALFPRAGNNGRSDGLANPDGDQPLGTTNTDKLIAHNHPIGGFGNAPAFTGNMATSSDTRHTTGFTDVSGNNETASKSMILSAFIRIN